MSQDTKILTGIGLITVIIVVVATFTIGNKAAPAKPAERVLDNESKKILIREKTHIKKGNKAKVTIVEFGDFQCSACSLAFEIAERMQNEYKDRIDFAFRQFPLNMHNNGYNSALAAESAGGQGKFWEMYAKLYSNQEEWSDKKDPTEVFSRYAEEIGIDIERFKNDMKSKKYDAIIQGDIDDGNKLGITATPTFIINGKIYSGVLRDDEFRANIENALEGK